VSEFSAESIARNVAATPPAEWLAVVLGVIYIVLIIRRNRWGWAAGGVSSALLVVLAARAHLPMQALLQFSYVVAAVIGWFSWAPGAKPQHIRVWPWSRHLLAIALCLLASLGLAQLLAAQHASAWPFLDSLVTCVGLFATWLVARIYLENWIYWLVIDAISVFLFLAQQLPVTALLFVLYFTIACFGLRSWLRTWRAQQAGARQTGARQTGA
jgi:nicotinamide mononucleotide transporter